MSRENESSWKMPQQIATSNILNVPVAWRKVKDVEDPRVQYTVVCLLRCIPVSIIEEQRASRQMGGESKYEPIGDKGR
eukprot:3821435-Ditylum_brightwellii.AAC.1